MHARRARDAACLEITAAGRQVAARVNAAGGAAAARVTTPMSLRCARSLVGALPRARSPVSSASWVVVVVA